MTVTNDEQEKQVVSKQRVADHGEVYTAKREVNAMLDLVKEETERIDSRFKKKRNVLTPDFWNLPVVRGTSSLKS